jgi:ABC-2 type transport system permease protein
MTTVDATLGSPAPYASSGATVLRPRSAGLVHDVATIAGRALRAIPRDMESVMPPLFIAVFFYVVNIATLENITEAQVRAPGGTFDFKAFMMCTSVLLGVTGVSRAYALVLDIQDGYFDRLLMTPVKRLAILLGHIAADMTVAIGLTLPVMLLGWAYGADFETGLAGLPVFVLITASWSLAFAGFGYAIALKTGNPAAVQSSFMLFFPFLFMTSSYMPRNQLSPWLDTVAGFNPVTYILDGLRSLAMIGWEWAEIGQAALAIGVVAVISQSLCFAALRGRIKRGG